MFWATFFWETLCPAIHMNATLTFTTYLRNMVASQVYPLMERVFPNGSDLFQLDKTPCHSAEWVQEWFEEHSEQFEVLIWPRKFSRAQYNFQHLWHVLESLIHGGPTSHLERLKRISYHYLQKSSAVHALMGHGYFGGKCESCQYMYMGIAIFTYSFQCQETVEVYYSFSQCGPIHTMH